MGFNLCQFLFIKLILDGGIRRVKVEMIVWNSGQRTPSGFLLKEKPVKQYNLWVKELIIP